MFTVWNWVESIPPHSKTLFNKPSEPKQAFGGGEVLILNYNFKIIFQHSPLGEKGQERKMYPGGISDQAV